MPPDSSARRGSAGSPMSGCRGPFPARFGGSPGHYAAVQLSGRGYVQRRLTRSACQRRSVRGVTTRDSWRRCAVESRRVRAASTARPAQVSRGDLTWRCRTPIWWRSTMISAFLTSSERGSRASQPHEDEVSRRRARELIVLQSRPAPLLSPETSPRPVGEQESQLRGGWHDFRHPQGPGRPYGSAPQPRAAAPRSPRPSKYRCCPSAGWRGVSREGDPRRCG